MTPCSSAIHQQQRGVAKWGVNEFFGETETHTNHRWTELPKQRSSPWPREQHWMKWPGVVAHLGGEYFFRGNQKYPQTMYHMRTDNEDLCMVGSVDPRKVQTHTIENALHRQTRGWAVQIVLHGRGVKAYWEPDYPHLMIRLGVGVKAMDCTRIAKGSAGDAKVELGKKGDLIVVRGFDKEKVGKLAWCLFQKVEANVYTMKGGHIADHPIAQKLFRKK
ncbi:unnamed protein product [Vitrella brassicaformis CCMP3155]|uniref:Uncharacterized protein n=2 Tax=Vitrella brassicaformis TaxID=1169539 RepID=A0A0G4FH75_VITBC|nr:unnamed protein product [Vitrella brassicaformis CCMP3155]|eukprot:CEM12209.1 unnamed protein product [Vitrella brassicaformis CCMP3155]